MAQRAIALAMDQAQVSWGDIDLIIDCSTSQVRPIPNNACHHLSGTAGEGIGIPCMDVQATCLGFLMALNVANSLLGTGGYQQILIVASERALAGVSWNQPESAALVGDGAAAVLLEQTTRQNQLAFCHQTFPEHLELCRVDGGGHLMPVYDYSPEQEDRFRFFMDGPAVFRVARKLLPAMVESLLQDYTADRRRAAKPLQVIPHQASPRALEAVRRLLDIPSERYHAAMTQTGNLAAASMPLVLDQLRRSGRIAEGQPLMLLGTSAGYSQAAMIFEL